MMPKDWSKREYAPRVVNMNAEAEFAAEFPEQENPWGQEKELDKLIAQAQQDSPGLDRTFLGVRVERCTKGKAVQMLVPGDVSKNDVELVARTLNPDTEWAWNERATSEKRED